MIVLAWKLWRREWHSRELRLLLCATIIAVTACAMISSFSDRLSRTMQYRASELLAADLVLSSPREISQQWQEKLSQLKIKHTAVLEFRSMVFAKDELLLANVRAINPAYPLRGTVELSDNQYAEPLKPALNNTQENIPAENTLWADSQLLSRLGIKVGDSVEIGVAKFRVSKVLLNDADRSGNFYNALPRLIMRQADVEKTQILQLGSRVNWKYYFLGDEHKLQTLQQWLKPQLIASQRLQGIKQSSQTIGSALERAQSYLGLSSLLTVILAGVAIAMAARRFSLKHFDSCAIFRSLGASQRKIFALYALQLFWTALLASVIGVALGFAAHFTLLALLSDYLPNDLLAPRLQPLLLSALIGLLSLLGFSLPPLLRLANVPTLRVLRKELTPASNTLWLVYGSGLILLTVIAYLITSNARLSISLMAGLLVLALILGLLCKLALYSLCKIPATGVFRQALAHIKRQQKENIAQCMAFSFTLLLAALILVLRSDLLVSWQNKLPDNAPNHFVMNLLPQDLSGFKQFLSDNHLSSNPLYPVVRGRLTHINDIGVRDVVSKENKPEPNAIRRELNLTWAENYGSDNVISEGRWWNELSVEEKSHGVSIEASLAKKLGIKLHDQLQFSIGSATLKSKVSSIRSVEWDSFNPNFYMIFAPGSLDRYPSTYLTSLHLSSDVTLKNSPVKNMVKQFPAITVIEVERILKQVRDILAQVTLAVEYMLLLVLAAAIALLFATVQNSLDERRREAAIYRTLGASQALIKRLLSLEMACLGFVSGLLALLGVEAMKALLYTRIFDLSYSPSLWLWLPLLFGSAALITLLGRLALQSVLRVTPLKLLREN